VGTEIIHVLCKLLKALLLATVGGVAELKRNFCRHDNVLNALAAMLVTVLGMDKYAKLILRASIDAVIAVIVDGKEIALRQ
jgi:hypothetical protein